jgi:FkbM family methyltransferase
VSHLRVGVIGRVLHDGRRAWATADDDRSRRRLALDFLLYRVMRIVPLAERERYITIRGTGVHYRRSRADIQTIREVWLDETYRLPHVPSPGPLVDLGANFGAASLWFASKYGLGPVVAVEPAPGNAGLLRRNLAASGVEFDVIEAAVWDESGTVAFDPGEDHNRGQAGSGQTTVASLTPDEVVRRIGRVAVLKIDIEGAEHRILAGDRSWLDRVECVILEFHPHRGDCAWMIDALCDAGFVRHRPGDVVALETFVRPAVG